MGGMPPPVPPHPTSHGFPVHSKSNPNPSRGCCPVVPDLSPHCALAMRMVILFVKYTKITPCSERCSAVPHPPAPETPPLTLTRLLLTHPSDAPSACLDHPGHSLALFYSAIMVHITISHALIYFIIISLYSFSFTASPAPTTEPGTL